MDTGLSGKRALVTGSSAGLGEAITKMFAAEGAILTEPVREMTSQVAAQRGWGPRWEDIDAAAASQWFPNDIGRFGRPEEIAAAVVFLAKSTPATSAAPTYASTAARSAAWHE